MNTTADRNRVRISLGVWVVWTLLTLLVATWLLPAQQSLAEMIVHGVAWGILAAAILVGVVPLLMGWHDLGLNAPHSMGLLWFPALYLVIFLGAAGLIGLPPGKEIAMIGLNTLIVGFSEEMMFRGILLMALVRVMRVWPAILWSCILFGAVHVLNVFITGEFSAAVIQAVTAAASGLVFVAIRLRTGSIWPAIIYHALWDFSTFVLVRGMADAPSGQDPVGLATLIPLALVLPNVIYALWLLRDVSKQHRPAELRRACRKAL
jgi:membrane protease YdiL (CAAX protease family)